VRVLGDGDLAGGNTQGVTVPGRHGEPPLGIDTERRRTLKHRSHSLKNTFHHLIALFSTLAGNQSAASSRQQSFSMKSTT
jgi:hypothetical protein